MALLARRGSTDFIFSVARAVLRISSHSLEIARWDNRRNIERAKELFIAVSYEFLNGCVHFTILYCRVLSVVSFRMTIRSCCKPFESASFFDLFSNVGHTTGSASCFLGFWPSGSYDRLFLACSVVLVIRPTAPASVLLAARMPYLTRWIVSSRTQRLLFFNTYIVVCVSFSMLSPFFQDCVQSMHPIFVASAQCCRRHGVSTSFSFLRGS